MKEPKINLELKGINSPDPSTSRFVILASVALILLMFLVGAVAFFIGLHGRERTMVPDLRGKDLGQALVEMQEKQLYPRVQLRYDRPDTRGLILEQNPHAGAIVKAGKRISLVVSRGAVVSKVENFVGQDLNVVRIHLQSLFTGSAQPLLIIRDPPIYVYDQKPAGTVLQQKPLPDSPLSGPTQLDLVVSRGPEKAKLTVPALVGLGLEDALAAIEKSGVCPSFSSRKPESGEKPGTVVSQIPSPGSQIPPSTRLALVVAQAAEQEDYKFGILKQSLPEYPYPIKLSAWAILPSDERLRLFEMRHPGGDFSLPYYLPERSQIIISILDQEKFKVTIE